MIFIWSPLGVGLGIFILVVMFSFFGLFGLVKSSNGGSCYGPPAELRLIF